MQYCEHCDRSFKSVQGLLGHHRMKHNASIAQNSAENRPTNEQLLEQIQWQLGRLEELEGASSLIDQMKAAAIEEHKHGMSDAECPGCILLVSETLRRSRQEGVDATVAYYESIPGVANLREIFAQAKANGKESGAGVLIVTGLREGETAADAVRSAVRAAVRGEDEEKGVLTFIG